VPRNKPPERIERLSARITRETQQQIADLGRLWGGLRTLNPGAVAEEAIARAWRAEFTKEKKK